MNKLLNLILLINIFISLNAASVEDDLAERKSSGKRKFEYYKSLLSDIGDSCQIIKACKLCERLPKEIRIVGYRAIEDRLIKLISTTEFLDKIYYFIYCYDKSSVSEEFLLYLLNSGKHSEIIKKTILSDSRILSNAIKFENCIIIDIFVHNYIQSNENELLNILEFCILATCQRGNISMFMNLYNLSIKYGIRLDLNNLLKTASKCVNNADIVIFLIEQGVELDCAEYIHNFANGFSNFNTLKYLIESEKIALNINKVIKSGYGYEILFHAVCERHKLEVVKYLLEKFKCPNINVQSDIGETSLHRACNRTNYNVVKYLVSKGANLNIKDEDGKTPIHTVCKSRIDEDDYERRANLPKIIAFLIDNGCEFSKDNKGYYCFEYLFVEELYKVLEFLDDRIKQINPEHLGRHRNDKKIITLFLKQDINIESQELNEYLASIYNQVAKIDYTSEISTLTRFKKAKDVIISHIVYLLKDNVAHEVYIKNYFQIFFSSSQITELLIDQMEYENYNDQVVQSLINKIARYCSLEKLIHNGSHILWHSLRYPKYRNISKLIINLYPDILENIPENMYGIDKELIAICADESGIKYSWNGVNIN